MDENTPLDRCPMCGKRFVEDRGFDGPRSLKQSRDYVAERVSNGEGHVTQPCPGCGFDLDAAGLIRVLKLASGIR